MRAARELQPAAGRVSTLTLMKPEVRSVGTKLVPALSIPISLVSMPETTGRAPR